MKKTIPLILSSIFLLGVIVLIFFLQKGNDGENKPILEVPNNNSNTPSSNLPNLSTTEELRNQFGKDKTLTFYNQKRDVQTENFYRTASFITKGGDADLLITDSYRIQFAGYNKTFYITITDKNINNALQQAGESFITLLHINRTDACKLSIVISIPPTYEDGESDPSTFSFCPSGS